ncbi:hypothetical protein IDJ75_17065 [Mucilaginibacter rigui]|uniref:DUF6705 domain-containing protein n=1 Tax=Mucilaginibacter rigui TaxID=534635 RepID=A0ABR7XBM2_9SPHI|nr:DUF6705 family protein [Mucilaginibacter rigui]MBD1387000.1 hypothetical protein [Mucilaginibacter rigui]
MKTLLIILSIIFCGCANAQIKTLDLNHGKYLENSFKDDFLGKWKANKNDFKVSISKEKKHIKRGTMDVYIDFLNIRITHFLSNGVQVANRFTSEMSLISVGNSDSFTGTFRDTISGNNIKINLKRINSNELLFTASLPEIDFTNHPENGTIFPRKVNLVRD